MIPIDQLIKKLSPDEVKASIYNLLKAQKLPVDSWQAGSVVRTIIAVVAQIFSGYTEVAAVVHKSGFLDLAEGVWLTLLARYVYGVQRIEATFANGKVTINNNGGGLYEWAPGDLIVRNPTTNALYANTEQIVLAPLQQGLKATVRAVVAGAQSTSAPGTVTAFVTAYLSVTVTNDTAIVGLDQESDPSLRNNCRLALGALSPNGPRSAYEYIAIRAVRLDGTLIGVTKAKVVEATGDGLVTVYVATASGGVTGTTTDPNTDLGAIFRTMMLSCVPQGVTLQLSSAIVFPVTVVAVLYVDEDAGIADAEYITTATNTLTKFIADIPIGGRILVDVGKIYRNAIIKELIASSPYAVTADLAVPAFDMTMTANKVATLNAPVITIQQVPG